MIARYGGLSRAVITVRSDGKLDVLRERGTGKGEFIKGCEGLEEAFEAIRAHGAPLVQTDKRTE